MQSCSLWKARRTGEYRPERRPGSSAQHPAEQQLRVLTNCPSPHVPLHILLYFANIFPESRGNRRGRRRSLYTRVDKGGFPDQKVSARVPRTGQKRSYRFFVIASENCVELMVAGISGQSHGVRHQESAPSANCALGKAYVGPLPLGSPAPHRFGGNYSTLGKPRSRGIPLVPFPR